LIPRKWLPRRQSAELLATELSIDCGMYPSVQINQRPLCTFWRR
jgi:hypothetical protein